MDLRKLSLTFSAVALVVLIISSRAALAAPVEGMWAIQDLILDIYNCQNRVCGRIAWTKDPHRRQTDCGRTIVWGLAPSGPRTWDDGSIYDPTDGNTYRLNASLASDGTLQARICRGIPLLGKTEVLHRVEAKPPSGWC